MLVAPIAPPGLTPGVAATPNSTAPARGSAAHRESPFAQQLERLREPRAQASAHPQQKSPSAPQPQAPATPLARQEAHRAAPATRTPAPRKPVAPADAESAGVDADGPALVETAEPGAAALHDPLATPGPALDPPAPPVELQAPGDVGLPQAQPAVVPANPALATETAADAMAGAARELGVTTRLPDPAANQSQQAQAQTLSAQGASGWRETPTPDASTPSNPALAAPTLPTPALATPTEDAPASAQLATPATSAEFRAALGAQVSVFVKAGVQQAQLHLNPAEMGPVSIQIVLDGQQAQVSFGADSAQTRKIIEASLPELASALRDVGLTLTGGGVSQHGGGQRQDASPHPNAHPRGVADAAGAPSDAAAGGSAAVPISQHQRSQLRRAAGGVDTYA